MATWTRNRRWLLIMVEAAALACTLDAPGQEQGRRKQAPRRGRDGAQQPAGGTLEAGSG